MRMPVYLDYAASTPVDPRVAAKMAECLEIDGHFGNAASKSHRYGWQADQLVEEARAEVAELLGAAPWEILWTSGATEADNWALKGVMHRFKSQGGHILTSCVEHKAVLDTCRFLESEGFEVTYLRPDAGGRILPEQVAEALREDTRLVSLMHVNNEVGAVTDIAAIGALTRPRDVLFHVDAAQSFGKLPIDVHQAQVDLMSICAHKVYGPKGVGALFVRRRPRIELTPLVHGGGQERGLRGGTIATHQVVGMGEAARLARAEMDAEVARITALRERLWTAVCTLDGVVRNSDRHDSVCGILNLGFVGVSGESLLLALKDLAVATGSACTSESLLPSHVLVGMGVDEALALGSLRLSIGRFTTEAEVDFAAAELRRVVCALRSSDVNTGT